MPSFAELIEQGTTNAWLFAPSAVLLGALHGLEPGHSKTMMAAFIVAIRGTVSQAALLGIAATISHTAVVWAIALGGMFLWQGLDAEAIEPYFQLASGGLIIAIAVWMLWFTWRDQQRAKAAAGRRHHHPGGHSHDHSNEHHHRRADEHPHHSADEHDGERRIETRHTAVSVKIFGEEGPSPRWRIRTDHGPAWEAKNVSVVTERPDGSRQTFAFADRGDYLESLDEIPHPHDFMARVRLGHHDHFHDYDLSFVRDRPSAHDHLHEERRGLDVASGGYQDAHELAHANDIRRQFADRNVTTGQIVLFGLTGGLIPCPAAITVLLLCLQLKQIPLGAALVLCFSIGLALTLVAVGAAAALSVRHATKRLSWIGAFARRAPYFSGVLIIIVGLYVSYHGWIGLVPLHT